MPSPGRRGKDHGPLSPVQHKILTLLSEGKSSEETRQILGYKDIRSINDHRWLARKKLGIETTWGLTAHYARFQTLRRLEEEMRERARRLIASGAKDPEIGAVVQHLESIADSYRYESNELVPPMVTPKCVHGLMISIERCRVCQTNREKEHTFQGVKVTDVYDNTSAMRCTFCSETRYKATHRSVQFLGQEPVDLPEGVDHGDLEAYRKHGCRCALCTRAQNKYKAEWRVMDKRRREARNNGLA